MSEDWGVLYAKLMVTIEAGGRFGMALDKILAEINKSRPTGEELEKARPVDMGRIGSLQGQLQVCQSMHARILEQLLAVSNNLESCAQEQAALEKAK